MIVSSLERTRADLRIRRLSLEPIAGGDVSHVARIRDPEGNLITFAEPAAAASR
jgi:hypothetical protein